MTRRRPPAIVAVALLASPVALAAPPPDATPAREAGWHLCFSPPGDLFPRALADPRRPMFAFVHQSVGEVTIPDSGDTRYGVRLGGRHAFARLSPADRPGRGFELAAEGAFSGLFDADNDTDNIAWDGLYGLHVAWAAGERLALRLALAHDSSHVGDEYIERTGRERIRYTREELGLGASWRLARDWRIYGEAAHGHDLRNETLMEPWRAQSGLEYSPPPRLSGGWLGWYAACDLGAYEEDDWELNVTAQAGLHAPVPALGRSYRVGLEYSAGRSHHGEFFFQRERYVGFGFWLDL